MARVGAGARVGAQAGPATPVPGATVGAGRGIPSRHPPFLAGWEAARRPGSPPGSRPPPGQKLNWLMLDLVNTNGGPSRMVLSAPTVNLPSLPAVKDWPDALVIFLEA